MNPGKYILLGLISISSAQADPSDFVRDDAVFRHGTYDRNLKLQAVYVDKDGSLLFPFAEKLQPGERESLEKMLELIRADKRQNFELRVYIHPEAPWVKIHELVTWLNQQNIGKLDFKLATIQKGDAEIKE